MSNQVLDWLKQREELKALIKSFESDLTDVEERITAVALGYRRAHPAEKSLIVPDEETGGEFLITPTQSPARKAIKAELLLARGVSADLIAECTEVGQPGKVYSRVTRREKKEGVVAGDEELLPVLAEGAVA